MFSRIFWVAALLILCALCEAGDSDIVDRAEANGENMVYSRGALLKNQMLTSCEVVPISNIGAFVAANCLASDPKGTNYTILWQNTQSERSDMVYPMDIKREQITLHSKYKESELAYNIAVIDFNNGNTEKGDNSILTNIDANWAKSASVIFDKLVLDNELTTWQLDNTTQGDPSGADLCGTESNLALINPDKYVCTSDKLKYMQSGKQIPYAVAATNTNSNDNRKSIYFYALYSHSLINSKAMQNATVTYNYYVVLSYFLKFAQDTLKVKLLVVQNGQSVAADVLPPEDMHVVAESSKGLSAVGGDFLLVGRSATGQPTFTRPPSPSPTETSPSDSSSGSQPTSSGAGDSADSAENTSKSKLSTGATAGIAVSMSLVGAALIGVSFIYGRKYYRKRSAELYWNRQVDRLQSTKELSNTAA